jgi:site-specific recombinase
MWRSAAGGGFIVAFMALIKLLLGKFIFAPLVYVFMHSLNYSLGFVLIHILHFTLATKQPAMTAATIAESIDKSEGKTQDLHRLADLVVATLRSQFAAIVGNIAITIPTAIVIAFSYQWIIGQPMMAMAKAQHTLHDLSPIASLAIPHAALTGVLLFLAGMLSGYFDNKAAYDRIPERIAHLGWLRRLLGPQRVDRFADYIGRNLGSLAGNFLLGIMLASLAPLGNFLGLPLDVRHVTLSSASFAIALTSLNFHIGWLLLFETLAGIALVGFTNLSVSFALALWVALKARGAEISASRGLIALLLERLRKEPASFFVPPRA